MIFSLEMCIFEVFHVSYLCFYSSFPSDLAWVLDGPKEEELLSIYLSIYCIQSFSSISV